MPRDFYMDDRMNRFLGKDIVQERLDHFVGRGRVEVAIEREIDESEDRIVVEQLKQHAQRSRLNTWMNAHFS